MGFYDNVWSSKGPINVINLEDYPKSRLNYQSNNVGHIIGMGTHTAPQVAPHYEAYIRQPFDTNIIELLDGSLITSTTPVVLLEYGNGMEIRGYTYRGTQGCILENWYNGSRFGGIVYDTTHNFDYVKANYSFYLLYMGNYSYYIKPDFTTFSSVPSVDITWSGLPTDYEPILCFFLIFGQNPKVGEPLPNRYIEIKLSTNYSTQSGTGENVSWAQFRTMLYGTKNPGFDYDYSEPGGGDGDYEDNYTDTIDLPQMSALNVNSISNTKFFSCYKMTPEQLNKLGSELWSSWFFTQISNTVLKPTDFIVSLKMIPIEVAGIPKLIKAGTILLNGATGSLISTQFARVDCGELEITKKWGGAIDYQTEVSVYLPFIGEVKLNTNEVMGSKLSIYYTIDILSGNCIASIKVKNDKLDAILYQYNGNVSSDYSITSADYSTKLAGGLGLLTGLATGAESGALSIVDSTSNLLSAPTVKRSGSMATSNGFMGVKRPYLILSRPIQSLPENYNKFKGYTSNITMKLSDCSGFTMVDKIHLDGFTRATAEELEEIEALLKEGVII